MDYCSPLQFIAPTVGPQTGTSRMVKSVTLHGHGRIARIQVEDTPLEDFIEKDHVEVEVHYCGMNFTDNYLRLGIIRNNRFPAIMGSECSGIVTRVGHAVTDLKAGQKVLCLKMQGGLFRHIVHVPRKHCFTVPDDITLRDAVTLGLHYLLAHVCLGYLGNVRPGDVVFMHSIAGGVGTAVTQLCHRVPNVDVLGTASESKFALLRSHGVKRVFRHEDSYVNEIIKEYPNGVDIIINSRGWIDIDNCLQMLKLCGTLIVIGSNCTATYPQTTDWGFIRPEWDTLTESSFELIRKNCVLAGANIGLLLESDTKLMQDILTKVFLLYSKGKIQPRIDSILPFEKVRDAMTQLCLRQNYGKIILYIKKEDIKPDKPVQSLKDPAESQPGLLQEECNQTGVDLPEDTNSDKSGQPVMDSAESQPGLLQEKCNQTEVDLPEDTNSDKSGQPVMDSVESQSGLSQEKFNQAEADLQMDVKSDILCHPVMNPSESQLCLPLKEYNQTKTELQEDTKSDEPSQHITYPVDSQPGLLEEQCNQTAAELQTQCKQEYKEEPELIY